MEKVRDYHYYTELMRNGFYDKLFFVDKIFEPWNSLVDYGCAEGFTSKILGKVFRERRITGYDSDPEMINRARFHGEVLENVTFTTNDEDLSGQEVIFLSSVIHEIYHYMGRKKIDEFWDTVFSYGRKYVIIRDMFWSMNTPNPTTSQVKTVREHAQQHQIAHILEEFERIFTWKIEENKSLNHWLLKYMYMTGPNYERELYENYLPMPWETIETIVPKGWEIEYSSLETLPWLHHQWKKDFGIDFKFPTHGKIIIKRK